MSSSASDSLTLLAQVRAALTAGQAEQPDVEAAYVTEKLAQGGHNVDRVLARLATGVSPYHVFGRYRLPGILHEIDVPPAVMPPGSVTPAVIGIIRDVCAKTHPARMMDLGCGTGVLGIAALLTDPGMRGVLVDVDPDAAACTEANLTRLGLADRATVICANADSTTITGVIDLIVANPPFVPDMQIHDLPARYRDHAPRRAVRGGADGLDILRQMAPAMIAAARPGCHLVLQIGDGQKDHAVQTLTDRWTPASIDHGHPNVAVLAVAAEAR